MFLIYAAENAVTLGLALVLDPLMGVPGLALAWVGPYTLSCLFATSALRRRQISLGGRATSRSLVRILIASGLTAGAVLAVGLAFSRFNGQAMIFVRLTLQAGIGTWVYLALARVMGIRELEPVVAMVRRLAGRPPRRRPA